MKRISSLVTQTAGATVEAVIDDSAYDNVVAVLAIKDDISTLAASLETLGNVAEIVPLVENAVVTTTASEVAAAGSALSASNSAIEAANSAASIGDAVTSTNADAIATALDAAQTALDVASTAADALVASNSAIDASASKDAALAAETAVLAAQSAMESLFDTFDDRFLGTHATDPIVDNDGDPILTGAIYYDSTNSLIKFYNGVDWEAAAVSTTQSALDAANSADAAALSETNAAASEDAAALSASNASTSETNAASSASAANADAIQVAADLVATNADTLATAADASATAADKIATNADALATAADRVQTGLDAIATAADRVQTGLDLAAIGTAVSDTAADVALTNADVVLTHADVVITNADAATTTSNASQTALDALATADDVTTTNANVVITNADVITTNSNASIAVGAKDAAIVAQGLAETAKTAAEAAQTATANIFDTFDDRFLGAKANDPALDNDGNPLVAGVIYYNTTDSVVKFFNGATWEAPSTSAAASAQAAATSATSASNSKNAAAASAIAADADATQTALDKVATNADVITTNANAVQTNNDRIQVNADKLEVATAADEVAVNVGLIGTSVTTATTKANEASTSAANALDSENAASASETLASQWAAQPEDVNIDGQPGYYSALHYATKAITSANSATSSADAASISASEAAAQVTLATTQAGNASTSATNASTAQGLAEDARDAAEVSKEFIDDLILGAKTLDPLTDNQGQLLQAGAVYYNTNTEQLKIWNGTVWDVAAFSIEGTVISFNGRQGAISLTYQDLIDTLGYSPTDHDPDTVIDANYVHTDENYTNPEKIKLSGIEVAATADQTGSEIKALYEAQANTNALTDSLLASVSDGIMLTDTDLDTIFTGGRYGVIGAGNTNIPAAGECYLEVLHDGTRTMQVATYGTTGKVYMRVYDTTWSAWVTYLDNVDDTSDLDKPISTATQTALDGKVDDGQVLTDVPAGALFTDTVYDDTAIQGEVDLNTAKRTYPLADETKLGLIEDNANNYTHPVAHDPSIITQDTNNRFVTDSQVTLWTNKQDTLVADTDYLTPGTASTTYEPLIGFTPEDSANKGQVNGYASLDASGLVPSAQLPSYVDDVIMAADLVAIQALTLESGKIYVAEDTNITYRWSGAGTTMVEISSSLALGTTSSTAFVGDLGQTAYDHSQAAHAPTNADNTALNETSHADVLVDGDIGVTVASEAHTHTGVYEPADATILKDADIGVTVASEAHNHDGTYEPADATIVKDADIGVTVLAQDDSLERLDKIISRQDIVTMSYTGGISGDKLSGIDYSNNYDEVFSYDGSDRLQYIDHQIGGVNQSYSTLVYNGVSGKLETVSYTASARV